MTAEPSEAAKIADEIFDGLPIRLPLAQNRAEKIIQRLLDDKNAEIKVLKSYLTKITKCRKCKQLFTSGEKECSICGGYCVTVIFYPYEF